MASLDYWGSPFRYGGHHLATAFVDAGWKVAYLSWPLAPSQLLRGATTSLRDRFRIYRRGGSTHLGGGLWAYVPGSIATPHDLPLFGSEWLHRNWPKLTVPSAVRLLRQRGFGRVDLLYVDAAIQRPWLGLVEHRRSVARITDRLSGFARQSPAMLRMEREIASSVDLVTYPAAVLAEHVQRLGARRTLHLPNGVDYARFAVGDQPVPTDLAQIRRPIAIYAGAIDRWFDFDLVGTLADRAPDVSFVLIGPAGMAHARMRPRPNLHLLGTRSHDDLPAYLHHADVGLIPFDASRYPDLVNAIHPLKLYEYLASGLPVVAARWDEIEAIGSPAVLCRTPDEFLAALRATLAGPRDREAGRRFAMASDWRSRARTMLDALDL
jgi:glycosyltransferase involved in cell wall biosynthesis